MPACPEPPGHPPGAAFLLTAVGTHAANRFAERIAGLGLTPPQTGLLRAIAAAPGLSQQAVAQFLGTPPSRLVALVDALADRGLVERRRNPGDRRLHALHVTAEGEALLQRIAQLGQAHDDTICAALDDDQRATLRALLVLIAGEQGLTPGVHPGYRFV
ncbi:MarR family transcriptional regulator [Pseudonocardia sp. CNS-139]|nr:MarR family transcriptional regulator [Pseudonocardia sp. CNS-139]